MRGHSNHHVVDSAGDWLLIVTSETADKGPMLRAAQSVCRNMAAIDTASKHGGSGARWNFTVYVKRYGLQRSKRDPIARC